jgi:hypothetical protein
MNCVSLARLTVIAALAGCIALIASILVVRADDGDAPAHAAKQPSTCASDEECAAECMKTAKTNQQKIKCWAIVSTRPEEDCKANGDCIEEKPVRIRFQPWQMAWQCNDLRVTVTGQDPNTVNYDIGGTILGGINFTQAFNLRDGNRLFLRGVPCVPLR